MPNLFGMEDTSTVDWLGNISTVFWFAGCNLRCRICFNHEFIPLRSGTDYTYKRIFDTIDSNRKLIDSVVMTGGEPLLQDSAVYIISKYSKSRDLKVMLDTNGVLSKRLLSLLKDGFLDRVAIDIKAPFTSYFWDEMCGIGDMFWEMISVRDSIDYVLEHGVELELRTTVIPNTYTDGRYLNQIINDIKGYGVEWHLQQFDSTNPLDLSLRGIEPPSFEYMREYAERAVEQGIPKVVIKSPQRTEILK